MRARRVRFLLNIIDRLPANSRYAEAVADDEEAAEFFVAADLPPVTPQMRLADWSPEVSELRHISERLAVVAAGIFGAAGARPPKFPTLPRPEVAADRIKVRRALERHRGLVAVLIPYPSQEV